MDDFFLILDCLLVSSYAINDPLVALLVKFELRARSLALFHLCLHSFDCEQLRLYSFVLFLQTQGTVGLKFVSHA